MGIGQYSFKKILAELHLSRKKRLLIYKYKKKNWTIPSASG